MDKYPTVFIVCGVHNDLAHTKKLLACIQTQTYTRVKTVIVDDGSTDGTSRYIEKNYSNIILLKDDGTSWWTGAISKGVEFVLKQAKKEDFVLTINNDCTFDKEYIRTLIKENSRYGKVIVGSLIVDKNETNTIIDAGVQISWLQGKFIALGPRYVHEIGRSTHHRFDIDTVTTKGTLYPIEVFQTIGNFYVKRFPHYLSDYEFGCRAKRAGWKLLLSYKARVYNDRLRTGIGERLPTRLSLSQARLLLFSRKSKINIIDQFWFIWLCCPPHLRLKNLIRAVNQLVTFTRRLSNV